MSEIDVTIFIRSRNEATFIGACLRAISEQEHSYKIEVIVLDSESTDGTSVIAQQHGAQVFSIPKKLFTFSSALNAGIHLAKGRFFVCLSAHCVPASPHWLAELLRPLRDDMCAAAYSRQIPWPDASIPEGLQIKRAFPDKPRHSSPESWKLSQAEGKEAYQASFHSNTSSAYKLETLKNYPFRKIPAAEDRLLATELLGEGYSIYYAPTSIAYHLHYPSFQEFRAVARMSTVSRHLINLQCGSKRNLATRFSYLVSQIKIPTYIVLLSILIIIPLLPGRKNRLRELHWRIASLGTTIGKSEGIYSLLHDVKDVLPLEVDSPHEILQHLTATQQCTLSSN
jgi:glycosyltransferase involved in cell wall biosynthesis